MSKRNVHLTQLLQLRASKMPYQFKQIPQRVLGMADS